LFNKDENELKKFAFKIFDTNGDGVLSENDMFELMQQCQGIVGIKGGFLSQTKDQFIKEQEIIPLGVSKHDIFLDVFSNDYIKIVKAIERKKKAKGGHQEDTYRFKADGFDGVTPKAKKKAVTMDPDMSETDQ
jgi:hypothetical protein